MRYSRDKPRYGFYIVTINGESTKIYGRSWGAKSLSIIKEPKLEPFYSYKEAARSHKAKKGQVMSWDQVYTILEMEDL